MASLANARRDEINSFLFTNGTQEALEAIRAHFNSHPALKGEVKLRERVNELLNNPGALADLNDRERKEIGSEYANTRIREAKLMPRSGEGVINTKRGTEENPFDLKSGAFDSFYDKDKGMNIKEYHIDVELRKTETGVDVYAANRSGETVKVGALSDNFLKNNPMNVDRCKAEIEIEDFSNGRLKNVSQRVIIDTDIMSGDVIDLSADMLPEIKNGQMEKI